jgi:hypothetical protein
VNPQVRAGRLELATSNPNLGCVCPTWVGGFRCRSPRAATAVHVCSRCGGKYHDRALLEAHVIRCSQMFDWALPIDEMMSARLVCQQRIADVMSARLACQQRQQALQQAAPARTYDQLVEVMWQQPTRGLLV